jgi:hypothetical protein
MTKKYGYSLNFSSISWNFFHSFKKGKITKKAKALTILKKGQKLENA